MKPLEVGGWNVFEVAVRAGAAQAAFVDPKHRQRIGDPDCAVEVLAPGDLAQRFGDEARQGVVTRLRPPARIGPEELVEQALAVERPLLVLEDVQDPQNVGSIFRAARALHAVGVVRTKHRSAPVGPAMIRASAGLALEVPMAEVGGVPNWLLHLDPLLPSVATVASGGKAPWHLNLGGAVALVLGSEGAGLKRLSIERATHRCTVPLAPPVDSLNVAQTAVLLLGEAARQKTNTV